MRPCLGLPSQKTPFPFSLFLPPESGPLKKEGKIPDYSLLNRAPRT